MKVTSVSLYKASLRPVVSSSCYQC